MSRRTTKQRRAAAWRHDWVTFVAASRSDLTEVVGPMRAADLAPLCADYSQEIERSTRPWALGRKLPGPWPAARPSRKEGEP